MMIKPSYAFRQAFRQIVRNGAMTTASMFSITAMLLILGIFFVVVVNVNMIAESAKSQFDVVQVYMEDNATEAEIQAVRDKAEDIEFVEKSTYIDKEEALARMKLRWGDNGYLLDGLEKNPFQNEVEVKLNDITQSETVVSSLQNQAGVEEIRYSKTIIDKLVKVTNTIQLISLILISILIIVSVVVVSNTVKLTVLARSREIEIMKYIGATNWFIRGPFFVEGMLIGLLSALVSSGVIALIYMKITSSFSHSMSIWFSIGMVPQAFLNVNLVIIFVALGISIGAVGSTLSMRKFLDT